VAYMSVAHHENEPKTLEGVIVKIADAISGSRPGARRDSFEEYIQRLTELENTAKSFKGVEKAAWDKAGARAVLEFPDGSNIFYDFKTKERATLPKAGRDFAFSAGGEALSYKYMGQNEADRWLVVSEPNGEGQELIQALGDKGYNVQVNWNPNNQVVATYRESTSAAGEEVFLIGLNGENFPSLQTNGLGFKGAWSPAGGQILYSVYSAETDYNPVLHIAGAQLDNMGAGNRSLRLATWPDKCAFAEETLLYCAVPRGLDQGSGIYPELADTVPDAIYKIDLKSNLSAPVALPETSGGGTINVQNMQVSEDGRELYFNDRVSGAIMKLRLR
ncbi:MAG: hypothetical protein AAB779_03430, partial [Patescibacteria group bacterium]